jgi:hypothetical protein
MPNEKLLVNKSRVEFLRLQIECDKSSKDELTRDLGKGMQIALDFLTEEDKPMASAKDVLTYLRDKAAKLRNYLIHNQDDADSNGWHELGALETVIGMLEAEEEK